MADASFSFWNVVDILSFVYGSVSVVYLFSWRVHGLLGHNISSSHHKKYYWANLVAKTFNVCMHSLSKNCEFIKLHIAATYQAQKMHQLCNAWACNVCLKDNKIYSPWTKLSSIVRSLYALADGEKEENQN